MKFASPLPLRRLAVQLVQEAAARTVWSGDAEKALRGGQIDLCPIAVLDRWSTELPVTDSPIAASPVE